MMWPGSFGAVRRSVTTLPVALILLAVVTGPGAGLDARHAQAREQTREQEGVPRSANGRIRLLTPKASFVVGEPIAVEVTMPVAREGEPAWLGLEWRTHSGDPGRAGEASGAGPIDISHVLAGGSFPVDTLAPWSELGLHDLRLLHGTRLIDVLTVSVGPGRVSNTMRLAKGSYEPGEPIEFTAVLPANRFYYMANGGPTVVIWPLELGGRRLSDAEQVAAWRDCGCSEYLESLVIEAPPGNPVPPFGARPGAYRLGRLRAPLPPGRYELRLTDRPYLSRPPPYDHWRFAFAASPAFTVEAAGSSPVELRFVRARPGPPGAPAAPATYEEVGELVHGEVFHVEARFAASPGVSQPATREATLEWVEQGVWQRRVVTVTCQAGLCRSAPIVLARPTGRER